MATLTRTIILIVLLAAVSAHAGDTEDLAALLHDFLANVEQAGTHDSFWAEDLVYTSSNGTRIAKADIMKGFDSGDEAGDEAGSRYTAEDVDIRIYGTAAVVAFKLVGTAADGSSVQYYFNTGTFVKRDGRWQAVAWQATKVPME